MSGIVWDLRISELHEADTQVVLLCLHYVLKRSVGTVFSAWTARHSYDKEQASMDLPLDSCPLQGFHQPSSAF